MNKSLCIFGYGYTAYYLAKLCKHAELHILGISRNPEKLEPLKSQACQPIHFCAKTFNTLELKPTHILISTPPTEEGDPTLKEFETYLSQVSSSIQSIGYLSTTSVYGDHQGGWVDETSELYQPSLSASHRINAEKSWIAFAEKHSIPLYIFRIAGIYGPYRNALQQLKKGKEFTILKKGQFFSRIHVEDLATIIQAALFNPEKAGIYNISDNLPLSNTEIDSFAASLLGIEAPAQRPIEEANLSGMALEFYKANKRVSNTKMLSELGIQLSYPTYQEGLISLFKQGLF